MPDQRNTLSDDDIRTEFARLRAVSLSEIRPPGTDAARRVVGRRRSLAAVASASLVVAAIAGGIAVARPAPGPTASADLPAAASSSAAPSPLRLYGIARGSHPEPIEMGDRPAAAGTYRFEVVCSGSGTGRVTLAAGQQSSTAPVACGSPPVSSPVRLDVTTDAPELRLRVDWDPGTVLLDTAEGWAVQILG